MNIQMNKEFSVAKCTGGEAFSRHSWLCTPGPFGQGFVIGRGPMAQIFYAVSQLADTKPTLSATLHQGYSYNTSCIFLGNWKILGRTIRRAEYASTLHIWRKPRTSPGQSIMNLEVVPKVPAHPAQADPVCTVLVTIRPKESQIITPPNITAKVSGASCP